MKLRNFVYLFSIIILLTPMLAFAVGMSGTTYEIPFDSINVGGTDFASSASYMMSDTLGENATGFASSGSYFSNVAGYRQAEVTTLTLVLSTNSISLGSIDPGEDAGGQITTTVTTNAANGYDLYIKENQPLTSGGNTISDFSGTIAAPIAWFGTGFGFTISGGTGVDPKWGGGTNYAGIPAVSTLTHQKSGYSALPDDTVFDFYVNSAAAQPNGTYSNTVTYSALPNL